MRYANIRTLAPLTNAWGSQVGSHLRPTRSHIETPRAFDNSLLPHAQPQSDTPADTTKLHGMEGVRGSNPLSSTKFLQIRSGSDPSLMIAVQLGEPRPLPAAAKCADRQRVRAHPQHRPRGRNGRWRPDRLLEGRHDQKLSRKARSRPDRPPGLHPANPLDSGGR